MSLTEIFLAAVGCDRLLTAGDMVLEALFASRFADVTCARLGTLNAHSQVEGASPAAPPRRWRRAAWSARETRDKLRMPPSLAAAQTLSGALREGWDELL